MHNVFPSIASSHIDEKFTMVDSLLERSVQHLRKLLRGIAISITNLTAPGQKDLVIIPVCTLRFPTHLRISKHTCRRMWSMPLCLLLVLGIHFSTQDMVTLAPSEGEAEVPEPDSTTPKLKVKPIIRSLHITSDIKYRYATTLVSSRVVNPSDQAGEAVFYVTLPESAFISEFLMCVSVVM
ncbi:hyaluronan metabolic process [Homalodisca vitripennis]|nr:hyaluronan metabolic process [Homalodisca vitripennis]